MDYKKRIAENRVQEFAKLFKIIFLVGARQVGKSSLLAHLFPDLKTFVFDPLQDLYNVRQNPDLFLSNFPGPLILDEIQFVPELLPSLKRLSDLSEAKGQYFLTGSQQLSILKSVAESLAGRVVILPLSPMTPHEMYATFEPQKNWFLNYLQNPEKMSISVERLSGLPRRLEVIWRGGMPGAIGLPQEALPAYFSSYIQTYVERDVRILENIEDFATFGRFLGLLGALTSQEINVSHLGRELGVVPKTAERWLRLLTYTYQWYELPAFHGNAVKRIIMKPKGIISDTGIACFLQRISSPDALGMSLLQGAMFESFCFNMLRGFCSALPMMPNFYHWRTGSGAEVDIIIELNGWLYPIEVKSATNVTGHDARGIMAFRETYPQLNIATGIILYAGDICYPVTEHVIAMPWDAK